jgi:uncharacterized membrane protein YhaH (DUF805 family)
MVIRRWAVFKGRANKAEYWYFVLFNSIIYITLFFLHFLYDCFLYLFYLYILITLIPFLSVLVRRRNDVGVGWLSLLTGDSEPRENKHGPVPPGPDISISSVRIIHAIVVLYAIILILVFL